MCFVWWVLVSSKREMVLAWQPVSARQVSLRLVEPKLDEPNNLTRGLPRKSTCACACSFFSSSFFLLLFFFFFFSSLFFSSLGFKGR